MDDILSGGKIDQSTSGPIPPSKDDRDRDILLEQKEKQDQDAIGGTQFPPRPQPLPPIPEAQEVAPPLPVIPSFDFNISGSALEEFREISRQTTMDILKNVNINGQSPSFEGSTISFNIPQQPPASEAFVFQGIMVPQPLPQIQPIPPSILQMAQPESVQEIQSFVVPPPSRQQVPQEARTETTEEPQQPSQPRPINRGVEQAPQATAPVAFQPPTEFPSVEFPKTEQPQNIIVESDVIRPPTVISTEPTTPELEQQKQQPTQLQQEPERESQQPPKPNGTDHAKDLDSGTRKTTTEPQYQQISQEFISSIVSQVVSILETSYRSEKQETGKIELAGIGTVVGEDFVQPKHEIETENEDLGTIEEANPNLTNRGFDSSSNIEQNRKSQTEPEEEKKESGIDGKTKEELKPTKTGREGDQTEPTSGMITVRLTRADGIKEMVALMATDFAGVSKGTTFGDRPAFLPPKNSYFEGVPEGTKRGDLLYWEPNPDTGIARWVVLEAVESQNLHVLGIQDGELRWVETEDCE